MSATSLRLEQDGIGGHPNFRLEVGGVLQRAVSVWAGNFVPFCIVGLVAYLPVLLTIAGLNGAGFSEAAAQRIANLVTNLMTLVLTGAVTYGVFRHLHGEKAGVGELLNVGLSRFGAVFVTGLMLGIAVVLGLLLLIIPGVVLFVRFWLAVPVAVIEELGGSASLSRSADLTLGNRWRILAIAVVMFVLTIVAGLLLGIAGALVGGIDGPWFDVATTIALIPVQCLYAVAPVVAYHDLRVGKEGVDVRELLRVFE